MVESRMLPMIYPGGDPKNEIPSLLQAIVNSNRPSLCDNATVRALVRYKWKTYGQKIFLGEMFYYIIGLCLLMTLLFVRTNPAEELTVYELSKGSTRQKVTVLIAVSLMVESLAIIYREWFEMRTLGLRDYFLHGWKNYVDLALIMLTYNAFLSVSDFSFFTLLSLFSLDG